MENKPKIERVIQRCACDSILPLALVYVFYIVLHGHLSPGGGFQGGILTVGIVLLIYLGHGYVATKQVFKPDLAHPFQGVALIIYVAVAFCGVAFATNFCQNFLATRGDVSLLFSEGTSFWTGTVAVFDFIVAMNVMAASVALSIGMLSILFPQDIDSAES